MSKLTETAPKRIYLQVADGGEAETPFPYGEEITWCEDSIMRDEVEYVRADLHDVMIAKLRDLARYSVGKHGAGADAEGKYIHRDLVMAAIDAA